MALRVRRASLIRVRLITTLMMALALVVQPFYGLVSGQVANAASKNITQVRFTTAEQQVDASAVSGQMTVQLQNASGDREELDQPNAKLALDSSSLSGEFSGNGVDGWQKSPSFDLNKGWASKNFFYKDAASGTFTLTATVAGGGLGKLTTSQNVTVKAPLTPVPSVSNGYFAIDNTGFNVGFRVHDFQNVSSVTVDLQKDDGTSIVKNTGTQKLFSELVNGKADSEISTEFSVPTTTAPDGYWNYGSRTWTLANEPAKAVITIDGKEYLTLSPYTYNVNANSPKTEFKDLIPADVTAPEAPTNLQLKYTGAASNFTTDANGNYVVRDVSKNIQLIWSNDPTASPDGVRTHAVYPDGSNHTFSQGVPYAYTNLNPRDSGRKFAANGEGKYVYTVEVKDTSGKWSPLSAPLTVYYVTHIPTATFETTPPAYVNGDFQVTVIGYDTTVLDSVGADVRDPSAPAGTNAAVTGCTNGQLLDGATLPAYSNDGSGVTIKRTCTISAKNFKEGHTYTLRANAGFVKSEGGSHGNANSDGTRTFTYETAKPTISNLTAVVKNGETYSLNTKNTPLLVKSGDNVTVTIKVDGTGSPVDFAKVRAYEQNVAAGNWHTYLFQDQPMTDNGNGVYTYTFTVPSEYTPVPNDTDHTINEDQYKNALDFNVKDQAGNTRGTELYFTIDNTAPAFRLTDDGNPRQAITDRSTVNPNKLGDVDHNGNAIRFTKESATDTLYVNDQPIFGHGYFDKGTSGQIGAAFRTDGSYTVYTKDLAGNQSAPITFTVDTIAPQLTVDAPADLVTNKDALKVTGTVFDANLSEYRYQILDHNKQNTLGSIGYSRHGGNTNVDNGTLFTADISNLDDGTYYISVWASDKAGNATNLSGNRLATPYVMKFTVDSTIPTATIDGVNPDGITFDGNTGISVHVTDDNYLKTDITRDGSTFHQTYHGPGAWFGLFWLKNGNYTMTVSDAAGNSTTYQFTIKRDNPTIDFVSPSRFNDTTYNQYFNNIGTIQVHATGDNRDIASTVVHIYNADGSYSSAWCGAAVQGDTASCDASSLSAGDYYVKVAATDVNGNATYIRKDFTIDNTGPAVSVNSVKSSSDTSRTISGTTEPGAHVSVTVHSTPQIKETDADAGGNWSVTFDNLAVGQHTVTAVSTDGAGNPSDAATQSFEVLAVSTEKPAPVTPKKETVSSHPLAATSQSVVAFNGPASGDQSTGDDTAVLGASTTKDDTKTDDGAAKGANTTAAAATQKPAAKFLGLAWYWWLLIVALVASLVYAFAGRRNQDA